MGSGSSRLESSRSRARVSRGNRSKLFSFFTCGGSSSRAALEMEDYPDNFQVNSPGCCNPVISEVLNAAEESSFSSGPEIRPSSCDIESGVSSEISVLTSERILGEDSLTNHELCNGRNCLSESKELVSPNEVSDDCSNDESCRNRSSTRASTCFKEHQSSDPFSMNVLANNDSVNDIENSDNKAVSHVSSESRDPSSSSPSGNQGSHSDVMSAESYMGEVTTMLNSGSDSIPRRSDVPLSFDLLRDESIREAVPSDLGLLMASREREIGDGSVLHVDVVSISSSIFSSSSPETSGHEARRNSRRLFWDVFSRRSSRGNIDSPTIVFSSDDTEDMSTHDRWLLDLGGDFLDDRIANDSGYLGSGIHRLNERRRHSRSEIWGRLRGGLHDSGRFSSYCPSGLHPDGSCSCESLLTEESSTSSSVSRIVMLAEALFEILDEIHRQPVSPSLMSQPAPESVVDSFPLKNYEDIGKSKGDDAEQCYICLAEYEEGDKIRVLPCHHEYHMDCVDKWLKEIHGVCPLCRGDVSQGAGEHSASPAETPST